MNINLNINLKKRNKREREKCLRMDQGVFISSMAPCGHNTLSDEYHGGAYLTGQVVHSPFSKFSQRFSLLIFIPIVRAQLQQRNVLGPFFILQRKKNVIGTS